MIDFIQELLLTALPLLLGYFYSEWKNRKKKDSGVIEGLQFLLKDKLLYYHDKYMQQGYIPAHAYEIFIGTYKAYIKCGGNGSMPHLKEEVDSLEVRRE